MIAEVENLLQSGTDPQKLILLGLEYRLITQYLQGEINNFNDLFQKLNTAIHAFAKRQMTWFRKMEKDGINIHWLNGNMPLSEKINTVHQLLDQV
jgi:tRNA dimethylallyltransferase